MQKNFSIDHSTEVSTTLASKNWKEFKPPTQKWQKQIANDSTRNTYQLVQEIQKEQKAQDAKIKNINITLEKIDEYIETNHFVQQLISELRLGFAKTDITCKKIGEDKKPCKAL